MELEVGFTCFQRIFGAIHRSNKHTQEFAGISVRIRLRIGRTQIDDSRFLSGN